MSPDEDPALRRPTTVWEIRNQDKTKGPSPGEGLAGAFPGGEPTSKQGPPPRSARKDLPLGSPRVVPNALHAPVEDPPS